MYSAALGLAARYPEALVVAEELLATAEYNKLEFATPYALCSVALACAGLRQWERAHAALDQAFALAASMRDQSAMQFAYSLLLRVLVQQGRYGLALGIEVPPLRGALLAAKAEVLLSRALALACAARVDEALAMRDSVSGLSRAIEPVVLTAAVGAVCALQSRHKRTLERIRELEATAFDTGGVDLLITTYRAVPDALALLMRGSSDPDRLAMLIRRVGDEDLAAGAGYAVTIEDDPLARLSPREREIYEFLARGVSDREIAEALYISRATAKRHVQNIYNKLGLHSRAAIAVQAALARSGQATAATAASDPGSGASAAASNLNSSPRASR
jgi:two-component system nitrate/nitrite response regulator NarL